MEKKKNINKPCDGSVDGEVVLVLGHGRPVSPGLVTRRRGSLDLVMTPEEMSELVLPLLGIPSAGGTA